MAIHWRPHDRNAPRVPPQPSIALEVLPKLTPDVVALIDQAIAGVNDLLAPPPVFP